MNPGRTIFNQLIGFLPMHQFRECVRRYNGNRRTRTFSCLDQFLCMAFTFAGALKSELAGRLRVMAEREQLRIPIDQKMERDWHSISRVAGSGGGVRFEADRSAQGHGDLFWAAALAAHAARDAANASAGLGYISGGKLRFAREGIW